MIALHSRPGGGWLLKDGLRCNLQLRGTDAAWTEVHYSHARRSRRNLAGSAPMRERTKAPIVGNGSPLRLRQRVLRLGAAEPGRIVKQLPRTTDRCGFD